jgi:hypothetical protein
MKFVGSTQKFRSAISKTAFRVSTLIYQYSKDRAIEVLKGLHSLLTWQRNLPWTKIQVCTLSTVYECRHDRLWRDWDVTSASDAPTVSPRWVTCHYVPRHSINHPDNILLYASVINDHAGRPTFTDSKHYIIQSFKMVSCHFTLDKRVWVNPVGRLIGG